VKKAKQAELKKQLFQEAIKENVPGEVEKGKTCGVEVTAYHVKKISSPGACPRSKRKCEKKNLQVEKDRVMLGPGQEKGEKLPVLAGEKRNRIYCG